MSGNVQRTTSVKCTHYILTRFGNYFCVDGRMDVGIYWLNIVNAIPDDPIGGVHLPVRSVNIRGDVCIEKVDVRLRYS